MTSGLSVAVVGAGPAGIYAAGFLTELAPGTRVDIFERLPAPYGLVRHGVAPDHPRIRELTGPLGEVLGRGGIRLFCGVRVGVEPSIAELRDRYDAVVVATGARGDVPSDLPGVGLPGSFGAADFVAWYGGHPEAAADWPLEAASAAVIGAGNVALDVTRMLTKPVDALAGTGVSRAVLDRLARNRVRDVHLFARRGAADTRFSPGALRELGELPGVDVLVDPADVESGPHLDRMTRQFAPTRQVVEILRGWSRSPARTGARRVHLHFHHMPTAVLGAGRVEGLRVEHALPDGYGHVSGSGSFSDYEVGAVYRAIGYAPAPVAGVPFDAVSRTVPHRGGAVLGEAGLYVTGWVKRGCLGLVGATRADARQTVQTLLAEHGPAASLTGAAGGAAGS